MSDQTKIRSFLADKGLKVGDIIIKDEIADEIKGIGMDLKTQNLIHTLGGVLDTLSKIGAIGKTSPGKSDGIYKVKNTSLIRSSLEKQD